MAPLTDDYNVESFDFRERVRVQDYDEDPERCRDLLREKAIHNVAKWIVDDGLIDVEVETNYARMEMVFNHRVRALKRKR